MKKTKCLPPTPEGGNISVVGDYFICLTQKPLVTRLGQLNNSSFPIP